VGKLTEVLLQHSLIGIDTSAFIYQLEDSEKYAGVSNEALDALAQGAFQGVTSLLTLMEVTVRPLQLGRVDVADEYEMLIGSYPNLAIAALDRTAVRRAAELRASYRLRPADALQVAACIEYGATGFITNDKGLRRVAELAVLVMEDFVDSE
jgi:predicted nucleic acid-binding protein